MTANFENNVYNYRITYILLILGYSICKKTIQHIKENFEFGILAKVRINFKPITELGIQISKDVWYYLEMYNSLMSYIL
jgi:hypothetical protein